MTRTSMSVAGAIGKFMATMSVVLLIQQGVVEQSLVGPFLTIVEFWDWLVGFVFSYVIPIGPFFVWLLRSMADLLGLQEIPELYPHWKHIFVLLMTIFGAFTKKTFEEGQYGFGTYATSVSLIFAMLSALTAGLIPAQSSEFSTNFFVAFVPAVCFWMTIILVWLRKDPIIGGDLKMFLIRCGIAAVGIGGATLWLVMSSNNVLHVGITCLLGFVVVVALRRIYVGFVAAKEAGTRIRDNPFTQRGVLILNGFIGATLFSVGNAGWRLVGG